MARYTDESKERVKDAVDMVELVSGKSDLRRVGTRWLGLCPFHDERTPSFNVHAERGYYYCFGCGATGDALTFVMETEALDFTAALETLAERYNIELKKEREDPEEERRAAREKRLYSLLDRAAGYYERVLWESGEAEKAREYLAGRGLTEEALKTYRVGYAPGAWDKLLVGAQRDGFRPDELYAAGLAQRNRDGKLYDRFRSRITFPLCDERGRVRGFGARRMRETDNAKYINTAEGELFHKSRIVYGIDIARTHAAKAGRVIAVEGYTDAIMLHQSGVKEAVAIMGTSLTTQQLAVLARTAKKIYLALDADSAGQEAMARAAGIAKDKGIELSVVPLPHGTDPADLVQAQGADALISLIEGAISVAEFEVRKILSEAELDSPGGRDRALSAVLPVIGTVPANTATWDHLMSYTADRLSISPQVLRSQISAPGAVSAAPPDSQDRAVAIPQSSRLPSIEAVSSTERAFLAMCLAQGETGRKYLDGLHDDHFSSQPLRRVRDHLRSHFGDPLAELPEDDPAIAALITQIAFMADESTGSEVALQLSWLQLEMRRIDRGLRHAEQSADYEAQRTLARERQERHREFGELMGQTQ